MKRVEGVSWDGLLTDAEHPGWEGWEGDASDRLAGHLQLLTQVCNALHFAHSKGVVHRDVKPQNVLIGRFGDPLSTCSPFDFNRDGVVSTPDLVTFIGLFGDNCAAFTPTPPVAEGEAAANLIAPSVGGVVR